MKSFLESNLKAKEWIIKNELIESITIRLYRGLEQKFNPTHDLGQTDAIQGYSTWTDNIELAKQYAGINGFIYYIDLPKSELGKDLIDENPRSDNYGDRFLFVFNKVAGINGVRGKEFLVYTNHELYNSNMVKLYK